MPTVAGLRSERGWLTYSAILQEVKSRAAWLSARGGRVGHELGVLHQRSDELVLWCLAIWWVGAVAVPIESQLPREHVAQLARRGRLKAIVSPSEKSVRIAARDTEVWTSGSDHARSVGHVATHWCPTAAVRPRALVCHTSGSTGAPKPIVHEHAALVASLPEPTRHPLVWCSALSPATIAGYSALAQSLLCGHAFVPVSSRHPRTIAEIVVRERAQVLAVTPALLELILRIPGLEAFDWSAVQVIGVGGATLPANVARVAGSKLGAEVVVSYGAAELGGPVALATIDDGSVDGEIGLPLADWELTILTPSGGTAAPGETGELGCRRRRSTSRHWIRTGDLARVLPNGRYQIVGRMDRIVCRGGRQVHPANVERVLETHPWVAAAAAVGAPSRRAGHDSLIAFVIPAFANPLEHDDLRAYCRDLLSDHEIPDLFEVIDFLPTTVDGKLHLQNLREMADALVRSRSRTIAGRGSPVHE